MRVLAFVLTLTALMTTGCNGALIERVRDSDDNALPATPGELDPSTPSHSIQPGSFLAPDAYTSINGQRLSSENLAWIEANYGLRVEPGDFWYDPISGGWGYWGGPTEGFLKPYMEFGYAPRNASGGGTGVILNGRELHPVDLAGLQQLVGSILPGSYWLDANGFFGYEGGQALGNLIYVAQSGAGSSGGDGGYFDSTYFGNVGSDGQSSYFYDSSTGCSVMSDGGVSC